MHAAYVPTTSCCGCSQLAFDSYKKKENKVSAKCVNFDSTARGYCFSPDLIVQLKNA
jgi:hypothetical protein